MVLEQIVEKKIMRSDNNDVVKSHMIVIFKCMIRYALPTSQNQYFSLNMSKRLNGRIMPCMDR